MRKTTLAFIVLCLAAIAINVFLAHNYCLYATCEYGPLPTRPACTVLLATRCVTPRAK